MSCNGCRVLRKGCKDDCMLRQCLQYIKSPQAQAHATLFVAKFFGRAGLMSFISSVTDTQRPALFQSLLLEACGRTVNPVSGAAGLLWTGNWHVCQSAMETVLSGGTLRPIPEFSSGIEQSPEADMAIFQRSDLDLCLTASLQGKRRPATESSMHSEEQSETTTFESCSANHSLGNDQRKLLSLFI